MKKHLCDFCVCIYKIDNRIEAKCFNGLWPQCWFYTFLYYFSGVFLILFPFICIGIELQANDIMTLGQRFLEDSRNMEIPKLKVKVDWTREGF